MRTYVPRYASPRVPYISEEEVFARTLTAVRTLKAMPDRERRFLLAGTKAAWPATLVGMVGPTRTSRTDARRHRTARKDQSEALGNLRRSCGGEWFATLALLPENIEEFSQVVEAYRIGKVKSPQVIDQRLLTLYSQGWSLKLIGQRFGWNEHQCERRLFEIARSLFRIANGTARIVKPGDVAWNTAAERVDA